MLIFTFKDWEFDFQVDTQKQFIIVCGNITYNTVDNFIDDFFHPARDDVNCEVLILNKMSPDLEFEGLLKRWKTRVQYFQVNIENSTLKNVFFHMPSLDIFALALNHFKT